MGWKFFCDIRDQRPRTDFFIFLIGCFFTEIGLWARGGHKNGQKSRISLKFTQNMYFALLFHLSKFHKVLTMFTHFFCNKSCFIHFLYMIYMSSRVLYINGNLIFKVFRFSHCYDLMCKKVHVHFVKNSSKSRWSFGLLSW